MNDDELMTLVREQRTKVPMTTPVQEILSRGRSLRARRRMPLLAGALGVAAVAAVAVAALVPSGQQAPRAAGVHLAAWTVTRQADGDVSVTIRELRDLPGLQAALHSNGVPAYVAFVGPAPARCAAFPASPSQLQAIYQFHRGGDGTVLTIDPSAMPAGSGLFIMDVPARPSGAEPGPVIAGRSVHINLVRTSQECPAS